MYMITEPRGTNRSSVSNLPFINVSKESSTGCLRPPYRFKRTRSNMTNVLRSFFLYFFLLHLSNSSSSSFWWAGITFDLACPIFMLISSVPISDRYLSKTPTLPSSLLRIEQNLLNRRYSISNSYWRFTCVRIWCILKCLFESESRARYLYLKIFQNLSKYFSVSQGVPQRF